ncbi:MACPF domain-containing protein At1g14780 [Amborella trichopoda]|uniref:MACPF domain-containing protein n=1 Tax=Amborella trichopoda TaxID=13333 RepID=W1PUI8_AMBTC|nr:MACPF domain-containing protein At1g14780 [Amborella trichopoda]ERN11371.1 hypothetical protein AMTR_s00176p00035220 [Amborella trichopoda]|eukprot:XP_006849790.1 MACPF domain-containing protein At1g14780 [Amborella trichopoda]
MSECFNRKCSLPGKIPSGYFNSMFGFNSDSWATDAAQTKSLAFDGYFIHLYTLTLHRFPLVLRHFVKSSVPATWDPAAIARFIERFGTHILVGVSIGGEDLVLARQDHGSSLETSELKKNLETLGDQLFTGSCALSPLHWKKKEYKNKVPEAFNIFGPQPLHFDGFSLAQRRDGVSVICCKRGGDVSLRSHCEWVLSVAENPDAINFRFIPITSLLDGVPGQGFLIHAINLYLRYKPPIEDMQYFLEFQSHKIWAPIHSDLPLGPSANRALPNPSLQFNLMGPKLYISISQVTVGKRPVTGMRLYLEGKKCNRLAIHLEHLRNTTPTLENRFNDTTMWQGSIEGNSQYLEAIQRRTFSHVCTAPVKYNPDWTTTPKGGAYVVTGAQLQVTKHQAKSVLHLRLMFRLVSDCHVRRSVWERGTVVSRKSGFLSSVSSSFSSYQEKPKEPIVVDSGVFPTGPPVPNDAQKLLRFVDASHVCKGPRDSPGHWLVTGAKLDMDKGKICLHVKFSLLDWEEDMRFL